MNNRHVFDEDKLLDHMEDQLNSVDGGFVVDFHGCDFFPKRWFEPNLLGQLGFDQ